jgi:hypothetical protein
MLRVLLLVLFCWAWFLAEAAEPIWLENFEGATGKLPPDVLVQVPGRGRAVHVSVAGGTSDPGRTIALPVPVEKVRGKRVFFGADVKTANISPKPNPWNGVKVMMMIETLSGRSYPQPEIPDGSVEWRRCSTSVAVPQTATNVVIVLGLEKVSGEAWFDNVSITPRSGLGSTLKPDPARAVFEGHTQPRLRGAMAGTDLHEADVKHFATVWKGNLLRLQIFESARQDRALEDYDAWLAARLEYVDQMLAWCEKYGVMAVVDLHSPPGGQAFAAGYITARGRIFTQPQAQAKFVEVWQRMAARYKGRQVIWGFDLVNEPDDSMLAEDCLDWNLCMIESFERHGFDWSYHAYREWQGWSLEHEGPLDRPIKAQTPGERQKVVTDWFARNVGSERKRPASHPSN